jgi:hypothetical protein
MWVVFRKSDGAVIATNRSEKIDTRAMLEEVARGLVGSPAAADFDVVQIEDTGAVLNLGRGGTTRQQPVVRVKGDGTAEIVNNAPEPAFIQITTDAQEFHPVDNVPLIPADGRSFLLVTLEKVNDQGLAVGGDKEDDVIWLRTDQGTLREDSEDPAGIRSVTLANGTARFRLYAGTERRLATVQMLSANPDLQAGGLQVEFI